MGWKMVEFSEIFQDSDGNLRISSSKSKQKNIFSLLKSCASFPVFVKRNWKIIFDNNHLYILFVTAKIGFLKILVPNIIFSMTSIPGGGSNSEN